MNSLSSWHQASHVLLRHPLRSALSALGITLGTAVLIAMVAIVAGAKRETLQQIKDLGANTFVIQPKQLTEEQKLAQSSRRSTGLTFQDIEALEHQLPPGTVLATLLFSDLTIPNTVGGDPVPVYGIDAGYLAARNFSIRHGRGISSRDDEKTNRVVVLGSAASASLSRNDGMIRIESNLYRIVGRLWEPSAAHARQTSVLGLRTIDSAVLIPISTLVDGHGQTKVSEAIVRVPNHYPLDGTAKLAERFLLNRHNQLKDFVVVQPVALIEPVKSF